MGRASVAEPDSQRPARPGARAAPGGTPLSLHEDERLSRHVIETNRGGRPVLLNTVTRSVLPVDADEQTLRDALCLAGQEREAIEAALFRPRNTLALTAILTWECNLRCTHCSVLHKLVRQQSDELDRQRVASFASRYIDRFPEIERVSMTLLGGEPLLRAPLGLELIESLEDLPRPVEFDTTTNLATELDAARLALLDRLDRIVVSLDGLKAAHDSQRRPYRDAFSPWARTMDNLDRLVRRGHSEKIWVQGAIRGELATLAHFEQFQRTLMKIGVRYDRVSFDTIHPTTREPRPESTYIDSLKTPRLRASPCCKFRGARSLVIDHDGSVLSDYYDREPLGSLDDPIDEIVARHRRLVQDSMPALHDEACLACPVIGYCWGGCSSGHLLNAGEPSRFCDQCALVGLVRSRARAGTLHSSAPCGGGEAVASCG